MACTQTITLTPDGGPIPLIFWQGDANVSARVDLTGLVLVVKGQALPFTDVPTITNAVQGEVSWLVSPPSALLMTARKRVEIWARPVSGPDYLLLTIWLEPWSG